MTSARLFGLAYETASCVSTDRLDAASLPQRSTTPFEQAPSESMLDWGPPLQDGERGRIDSV